VSGPARRRWGRRASWAVAAAALPLAAEVRLARVQQPLTGRWADTPVTPPGATLLGFSFRPRQAEALGLSARDALARLLEEPFALVRLAAYWDRVERRPGELDWSELDEQVQAAEAARKSVIICTGAVKAFGYPEYFVPVHHRRPPLREGTLVKPATHPELFSAATGFAARVVERYRDRASVVAWQVEHEAFDPLGFEHSWRLSASFVEGELEAVRRADPGRPVVMNGFLPTSSPVRASQAWRCRGQGDSMHAAPRLADVVGIDFYPRHALCAIGGWALYLDGSRAPWHQGWRQRLSAWQGAAAGGDRQDVEPTRNVMVTEAQSEPWEAQTVPPNPTGAAAWTCPPERVIDNYNQCMGWQAAGRSTLPLWAYLFWGAEYWLARSASGDHSYMRAVERVLAAAGEQPVP
jgi:hypothetical protein